MKDLAQLGRGGAAFCVASVLVLIFVVDDGAELICFDSYPVAFELSTLNLPSKFFINYKKLDLLNFFNKTCTWDASNIWQICTFH